MAVSKRLTTATKVAATLSLLCAIVIFGYQQWASTGNTPRASMLALLPGDANTVVFVDVDELRQSPFLIQLYRWAPHTQVDTDYAQFLRETGFDYERDLDRLAIAAIKRGGLEATYLAVADGRFDRKKIAAYALQSGTHEIRGDHEIFSVPLAPGPPTGTPRTLSLTFLRKDRMALAAGADLASLLSAATPEQDANDWRERFDRLAGSPVFALVRQDATPGSALASRAPGGLQSPQLATLLDQLQWVCIAGKPEGNHLRVVAEGESATDTPARQLADLLNGILLMAQAGLNGPQVRQQLNPQAREAYLKMFKSADVSRIDRGETKSVRLVFDVSPTLLDAARSFVPATPPRASDRTDPPPAKPSRRKK
jgi:hypothetical protein